MSVLELTPEESQLMECALRAYEETLSLEIMHAEMKPLREGLRHREGQVHALLERVREGIPELVATD